MELFLRPACRAALVWVTVCMTCPVPAAPAVGAASDEAWLDGYLDRTFPAVIERVTVSDRTVTVSGRVAGAREPMFLAEIPLERLGDDPRCWETTDPVAVGPDGRFTVTLDRFRDRGGLRHDRLTARWQLVVEAGGGHVPRSHARYADIVPCRAPDLPAARPTTKKGLGGWQAGRLPDEIESLGVGSVTVNVVPHSFVSLTAEPGTFPFSWQGRTYHAREAALAQLDDTFRRASAHGLMVSAIILIGNPARGRSPVLDLLAHPDAVADGVFAMPNVTHPDGVAIYGGLLDLMAERWSRPDGRYGRVHHWIMHNEVDAGYEWTNCGVKPAVVFMDLLQRSLRLMHLVTRQYDPHARTFISLTHHWAHPGNPHWYGSRRMLDLLARFGDAEGDFPWAVAFHAYPESLANPRTWEDTQATFRFDTPKITPRNLEVLEAYLGRARFLHAGQVRPIHFSENGFNSPDYGPESLADQAAGMAYAWKKVRAMPLAEVWHYHNWIDNRHEDGLRIGLRTFPDEPTDPLAKKPIWHLYRALGTPDEDAAAAPALGRVGLASWDDILHRGPIDEGAEPTGGAAADEAATLADGPGRWSRDRAQAWHARQPWLVGCNYLPSNAINQLEMFQAETFSPALIDKELEYAAGLGFNGVRVFLHDLLWKQDPDGFLRRCDTFLSIADRREIGVMFVLFDSCWHPAPQLGPQPEPLPHTHNSGWVQSPGSAALQDPSSAPHLRDYVVGVTRRFAADERVVAWDIWNEPDNVDGGAPRRPGLEPRNKPDLVNALLPQAFAWAREADPSQPLTSGVWRDAEHIVRLDACKRIQLANSDVISFHTYGDRDALERCITNLGRFRRPLLCTEFMARPNGSVFEPHLGIMKDHRVAAFCWGFVNGKSQTIYPWDSWTRTYRAPPAVWFHDVLEPDGTPFRAAEVDYIRRVTATRTAPAAEATAP